MLLHNLFVIDLLSGVTVDEDTPMVAPDPDISGFYQTDDGLVSVQVNQAADYLWGFLEVRKQVSVSGYSGYFNVIEYYDLDGGSFYYSHGDLGAVPDPFSISSEGISTNADGQLVLDWHMTNGRHYVLTRYSENSVVPDEALNGLPRSADGTQPDAVKMVVLSQRAPLDPTDEAYLESVNGIITDYLQAYFGSMLPLSESQLLQWLMQMQVIMRPFTVLDTQDGVVNDDFPLLMIENDQFPLVRYRLRELLQSTPLGMSDTDTRSLYQGFLEVVNYRGVDHLVPLDQYILYITGIHTEEAQAIYDEYVDVAGLYTYQFKTWSLTFEIEDLGGGLVAPTIIKVRRVAADGSILWSNYYFAMFVGPALGLGGEIEVGGVARDIARQLAPQLVQNFSSNAGWSDLKAMVPWEPSDFAGMVTVYSLSASIGLAVAIQLNFHTITTFFELTKGLSIGYGRLVNNTPCHTLNDVWENSQFVLGVALQLQVSFVVGEAYQIAFTENIEDQEIFEPMLQSASYTSTLPVKSSGIHFAVDGYTLNADGQFVIKQFAAKFHAYLASTNTLLEVHGYASPSGTDEHNLVLSGQRAQSVYNYLYAVLGDAFAVPTQRTLLMGHGEYDAKYLGQIPDGTEVAIWRRVDLVLNGALVCSVFGEKGSP